MKELVIYQNVMDYLIAMTKGTDRSIPSVIIEIMKRDERTHHNLRALK